MNGDVDVVEFKSRVDGLNKRNQLWGFDGFIGQMHFNKLLNAAPDESEFGDRLREAPSEWSVNRKVVSSKSLLYLSNTGHIC